MRDDTNPLDYPERPEIARERARRVAALAEQCGEMVSREPVAQLAVSGEAKPSIESVLAGDDLDAAMKFFAAAREEKVDASDPRAPSSTAGATTLDFSRYRARKIRERLLSLLDDLVAAIERRDLQAVWDVLDEADACRCFPPAVREEALQIARMPHVALRAPVKLYRYYHMLGQLGDEPVAPPADPRQLALDWSSPRDDAAAREERRVLPFPDRRVDGGPRDGPGDRRHGSGSR